MRRRKIRSDKKKQIRPSLNLEIYESIYRLSTITRRPVKDICEILILHGLKSDEILVSLSQYLKRNIQVKNSIYRGHIDNEPLYDVYTDARRNRVSFTLQMETYDLLYTMAYCFGVSVSKMAAVLLFESLIDIDFIESFLESYLDSLNDTRKRELRKLLKYIQSETAQNFTLADLLAYLVEQPIKWLFGEEER